MSGLDRILSKIISDAQAKAEQEISEATQKAAELLSEDSAAAVLTAEKRIAATNLEVKAYIEQSRSAAKLQTKRTLLKERNRIIDEVLIGVRNRIRSMPDAEYFSMLSDYISAHSQNEPGMIVLNSRDLARVPAGYSESLSDSLSVPMSISMTPGDFDAGCVLIYGEVEYNGTLSALLNEKKDELRDLLNKKLFAD